MTIEETKKIMEIIDIEYKGFIDKTDISKAKTKINIWHKVLEPYNYKETADACLTMLATFTHGTAPKIGDLANILVNRKEESDELIAMQVDEMITAITKKRHLQKLSCVFPDEEPKLLEAYLATHFGDTMVEVYKRNKSLFNAKDESNMLNEKNKPFKIASMVGQYKELQMIAERLKIANENNKGVDRIG